MSTPPPRLRVPLAFAAALFLGVAADRLLFETEGVGLNVFLLFGILALAVGGVLPRSGVRIGREATLWLVVAGALAATLLFRAAPALQVLAVLGTALAFALPALHGGRSWLRGSGVTDPIEAVAGAVVHAGFGPLRLLIQGFRGERGTSAHRGWGIVRGVVLAIPLLFVFGALLVAADPIFAEGVTRLSLGWTIDEMAAHLVLTGLLTWLALGYLSGWVSGTRLRGWVDPLPFRPSLGILEIGTALALLNLLFAAFIGVQARTLFGGSAFVELTPGLTYADYARAGFGQLVWVTLLVFPTLLGADALLRRTSDRDEGAFRGLSGVLLVFLLLIIASAFQRVRVYEAAYGLTLSRLYGGFFLAWLTFLGVWLAATLLRGQRHRFAAVALGSGFAFLFALQAANPDAVIVRRNLDRGGEVDGAYLAALSADAVPELLAQLPRLAPNVRCEVATELDRRWGNDSESTRDWRSWNASRARARRLVQEASPSTYPSCSGSSRAMLIPLNP